MQNEKEVYEDFARGDISFLDAVQELEAMGYEPQEAELVVSEWAEELETPERS